MKTSTVKTVEAKGTYSNGHNQFNKFQVSFKNGDICNFLAKGEFKKAIGDLCDYEITNEEYNSAKVIYPKKETSSAEPTKIAQAVDVPAKSKEQLILKTLVKMNKYKKLLIRQSMTKASVDFHSNRNESDILDVMADAQILINFINE
tara:strand:- start:1344 stop:1784 length:441 start_codon:yes stop_codon:yes gene_type:complete